MIKKNLPKKELNKSPKDKFKKLILSWWFWVIIAVISYFIFVLTPVEFVENSLEFKEGFNSSLKTIFAYITQIAWIIVVCLLIFEFIKWIQKTKIGDYWKTAITILGIIGIIAYVIYSVSGWAVFKNLTYEYDERIGDLDNKQIIRINIELLEGDGYEVLYFGYLDFGDMVDTANLKMKSLGNRNNQVWDGLHSLGRVYPNAPNYEIVILEPMQECRYNILGNVYRGWAGSEDVILDGEIVDSLTLHQLINYQIDEEGYCE